MIFHLNSNEMYTNHVIHKHLAECPMLLPYCEEYGTVVLVLTMLECDQAIGKVVNEESMWKNDIGKLLWKYLQFNFIKSHWINFQWLWMYGGGWMPTEWKCVFEWSNVWMLLNVWIETLAVQCRIVDKNAGCTNYWMWENIRPHSQFTIHNPQFTLTLSKVEVEVMAKPSFACFP